MERIDKTSISAKKKDRDSAARWLGDPLADAVCNLVAIRTQRLGVK
jgi:hypothetical protein